MTTRKRWLLVMLFVELCCVVLIIFGRGREFTWMIDLGSSGQVAVGWSSGLVGMTKFKTQFAPDVLHTGSWHEYHWGFIYGVDDAAKQDFRLWIPIWLIMLVIALPFFVSLCFRKRVAD